MDNGDDTELVNRCLGGDQQAFEPLVARYQKVLFNVALRMVGNHEDARDIAQTTFVKAYEKLATYDPRYRFFSWIYRIMINESLNLLQRRKTHQPLDATLASVKDLQQDLLAQERSRMVQTALLRLPAADREVLILRHYMELSYTEMSETLGIPEKTVKSRLYSARQRLADLLVERSEAK